MQRLGWLDELRGIAALGVMLAHGMRVLNLAPSHELVGLGVRGVQLFYIISGYILFRRYGNLSNYSQYKSFIGNRFFRIAPLFYFVTLLCAIGYQEKNIGEVFLHLLILPFGFFRDNRIIGTEWSIFVEFWFYVSFPILLLAYKRFPVATMIAATMLSFVQTLVIYASGADVSTRQYWHEQPSAQLPFFIFGFAIASLQTHLEFRRAYFWGGFSAMMLALIPMPFTIVWYGSLFALSTMVLGYEQIRKPQKLSAFLEWAGSRSYSIYLLHLPLLLLTHQYVDGLLAWGIFMISVFLLSDLTWRLIEQPGINLGRKLISASQKQGVPLS